MLSNAAALPVTKSCLLCSPHTHSSHSAQFALKADFPHVYAAGPGFPEQARL